MSAWPLLDWPVKRPRAALAISLLLTVAALLLILLRLRPETSFQGLLDPADPSVTAMADVLDQFPVANELLVLVSLPNDAKPTNPVTPLLAYANRLRVAAANDADAKRLVTSVRFRAESQAREFVEHVIIPNALYYLNDSQYAELSHRLTRAGMDEELAKNQRMLSLPGPAAGALAKTLAKDPLRLHEFLLQRAGELSVLNGGGDANPFDLTSPKPSDGVSPSHDDANGAFLSKDRRSLLVRIGGARTPSDFVFAREMTDVVRRLADSVNADHLQLDLAGAYAMSSHTAAKIKSDSISDVYWTVIGLVVLFIAACKRPIRLFTFAFVPVAIGMLWGFGAYALIEHTITPLAAVVGGTLGAIGLDYTIHFITHFQEIRESSMGIGETDAHALSRTSRELFWPSLAAWLTSVIGFAAVAISPVRVLRDFAILGTLALVGAWAATLFLLPAMLAVSNRKTGRLNATFAIRFSMAGAFGRWIARHARPLLAGSCVLLVSLAAYLAIHGVRLQFSSDLMVLHPQPSPPLEAQRKIAERMQLGAGSIIVYLRADAPDALVALAHDAKRRLSAAPLSDAGISATFGIDAVLPDPRLVANRRAALDPNQPQRVADDLRAALVAGGFAADAFDPYVDFLKTLVAPSLAPTPESLAKYPEIGQLLLPRDALAGRMLATRAVTILFTRTLVETREGRERALSVVRDALRDLPGATVTGTAVIGHDLEAAVDRDLPRSIALALAGIVGYLLIHFRSIRLAAMALLPIAASLLCVAVYVTMGGVQLNVLHTVMIPLLLGINLDYGIFAVHAWHESRTAGELTTHFPASFAALIICGGSTTIGFGSLIYTSIPAVESLGWLINVGVISCVLATLFLLWPAMLAKRVVSSPRLR